MMKRALSTATMTMILTALAGVTFPMSAALACGPYGGFEAPRPEPAQSWTCQSEPRVDDAGAKVVDVLRLDTTGGEDTLWGFLLHTVPADGSKTLKGRPNDFGLARWSPDTLLLQLYGRSVTLTPSLWSPKVLHATLWNEFGERTALNNFQCTPTK